MAKVQEMLETYPRSFNVDADLLARTIEALVECANTCTQCADACLSESDVANLAKCIRLNLDCADVCVATSRVASRQTEYDANLTRCAARILRRRLRCLRRRVRPPRGPPRALPRLRGELPALRAGVQRAARRHRVTPGRCPPGCRWRRAPGG